jgi:hypothetical protein
LHQTPICAFFADVNSDYCVFHIFATTLLLPEGRMPWTMPENLNAKAQILIWVEDPRKAAGTTIG